jgi:hypothetical protein
MWYYVSVDLFWNYASLNVSQESLVYGVYWAGKEVVSRQGGRHLGLHNVGFQGFWFGKRGMVWKELIPKMSFF